MTRVQRNPRVWHHWMPRHQAELIDLSHHGEDYLHFQQCQAPGDASPRPASQAKLSETAAGHGAFGGKPLRVEIARGALRQSNAGAARLPVVICPWRRADDDGCRVLPGVAGSEDRDVPALRRCLRAGLSRQLEQLLLENSGPILLYGFDGLQRCRPCGSRPTVPS